jgi:hypothetical protein
MSALTSSLLRIALLAGLLSFTHGAAFAQSASTEIANDVQPPPRNLIQPQQPVAGADANAASALRGPEQRVALVIGNSSSRMRRSSPIPTMMHNRWPSS